MLPAIMAAVRMRFLFHAIKKKRRDLSRMADSVGSLIKVQVFVRISILKWSSSCERIPRNLFKNSDRRVPLFEVFSHEAYLLTLTNPLSAAYEVGTLVETKFKEIQDGQISQTTYVEIYDELEDSSQES